MRIIKNGFSLSVTINLPNYNSIKLGADCEMDMETGSKEEARQAMVLARRTLFLQLDGLRDESFLASLKGLNQEAAKIWKETTEKAASDRYAAVSKV